MYRAAFSNKFNTASSVAISNILAFSRGISMTFTLQDLKHLEIMAELEERPASPQEESIVETVNAPTSLTERLLTLASKLRTAGFVQQADSLESTFGMYKKAEVDANLLYRAHSETGDDLLEFAHPDGDVEIAPAQNQHGHVETPISQHKKIIDIVCKTAADVTRIPNADLVHRFTYLKNHVSTNFLNAPGIAQSQHPAYQGFIQVASDLFNFADELATTFNAPGETSEQTAVAAINEAVTRMLPQDFNEQLNSIAQVNEFIKNLVGKVARANPVKKTAILDMLRTSLGVKTAQVPAQRPRSEHDMAGYKEFGLIVEEIKQTLSGIFNVIFENNKYNVRFDSGLTTVDYKEKIRLLQHRLDKSTDLYKDFIDGGSVNSKSGALSAPDLFLKGHAEFAQDIVNSMAKEVVKLTPKDSQEKGFDNVTFAPQVLRKVTNLQHRWYKFWGTYGGGKKEDAAAHGKFITHGQVSEMVKIAKSKLDSLNVFINDYFIKSPEVQGAPPVLNYLTGLVGYIKSVEANFDTIVAEALKFTNGVPSPLGGTTEMTTENIKNFITDKEFASKLDLSSNETFAASIDSVMSNIMTNLVKLVKENKAFEPVRETALKTLTDRIGAVRAK